MDNELKFVGIFAIRAIVFALVFYAVFLALDFFGLLEFFRVGVAWIVFEIVSLFFPAALLNGAAIQNLSLAGEIGSFSIVVEKACVGTIPIFSFIAIMLALPGIKLAKKYNSLFFGVLLIFLANIFRLVAVIFVAGQYGYPAFEFAHAVFFKVDMMFFVLAVFGYCVLFMIKKEQLLKAISLMGKKDKII